MAWIRRRFGQAVSGALGLACALAAHGAVSAQPGDFRARQPADEVIYVLMPDRFDNADPSNDRGGLSGDRMVTGFDPADTGFFHGGDLAGVKRRLDYIRGLGATAIWMTPIFRNQPVQGQGATASAGYHGYWVTDFTDVDPHFGSRADFKALVEAAHARGMKVYLDIIVNHTADVIQFRECPAGAPCPFRDSAAFPHTRRGGMTGPAINPGFAVEGAGSGTIENWARLTDPTWAYTPYIPQGRERAKTPEWLNDPVHYSNRGQIEWRGEASMRGDFNGLDDLETRHPRVIQGLIDIYGGWIDEFGIDGYRIDTAKHVDADFLRMFSAAMTQRARARGIPNFALFGEAFEFDPGRLAHYTRSGGLPSVLDFAFQSAIGATVSGREGTDRIAWLVAMDANYEGGAEAPVQQPVFLSNHDIGRFAGFVRNDRPGVSEAEALKRVELAHAFMFLLRGAPVIYAGDEQGFASRGGDKAARETQFGAQARDYLGIDLLGTDRTHAQPAFDTAHPLYRAFARLAAVRSASEALRRGLPVTRLSSDKPGLYVATRRGADGKETLVAFNTSDTAQEAWVSVDPSSMTWIALIGPCAATSGAPGSVRVSLPPLGYAACAAR